MPPTKEKKGSVKPAAAQGATARVKAVKTTKATDITRAEARTTTIAPPTETPKPKVYRNELDECLARMDAVVQEACKSPRTARALLIKTGVLTKRGTFRKICRKSY